MYCPKEGCNHTGEYLLMHRNDTITCPECQEGELVKKAAQVFNVGGANSKTSGDNSSHEFVLDHCLVDGTHFPKGPRKRVVAQGHYELDRQELPCGCYAMDESSRRPRKHHHHN